MRQRGFLEKSATGREKLPEALSMAGQDEVTPRPHEMFVSAIRSSGDLAGIFEYDGETGWFYL